MTGPGQPRGRLLIVGTPIGNLGDLSSRAAEALRSADLVVAEDTRVAARLLAHVGSRPPHDLLQRAQRRPRLPELLGRLDGGAILALTTDAGMPGVSDPGGAAGGRRARSRPRGGGGAGPVRRDRGNGALRRGAPRASCSAASCRRDPGGAACDAGADARLGRRPGAATGPVRGPAPHSRAAHRAGRVRSAGHGHRLPGAHQAPRGGAGRDRRLAWRRVWPSSAASSRWWYRACNPPSHRQKASSSRRSPPPRRARVLAVGRSRTSSGRPA